MQDAIANNEIAQQVREQPSITWLNMSGDVTITWDESNREKVLDLVRTKMRSGFHFFVLKPRFLPILGNKKVPLTSADQLNGAVGVVVPDSEVSAIVEGLGDKDVAQAVRSGSAKLTLVPKSSSHDTTHRAATAEEVVQSRTVAVRAIQGG